MLVNENSSGLVKLTDDDAPDFDPIFRPDGKRVIFSSIRNGSVDLYSVPVPETALAARAPAVVTPQRVTSGEGDERDPHWDRSGAAP